MKYKMLNELLPIKTERLIINKTSINDVDLLLKLDKQKDTQTYLGGIKNKTKEERINFLKKKKNSLTIYLKDQTPIGFIGLKINEEKNEAELSYIIDINYCSKGYCTEAAKYLIDICFKNLDLSSIYAETLNENKSSKRVLEKLGFEYNNLVNKKSIVFLNYILKNNK